MRTESSSGFTAPVAENDRPMKMQPPGDDVRAQAMAADQSSREATMAQVGAALPTAIEPLQPASLNTLKDTVLRVVDQLSGGQAAIPELADVSEPANQVPAEVGALLGALQTLGEAAGVKLDVEGMVRDNRGIESLAAEVDAMGANPTVMKAAKGPAPTPQAPTDTEMADDEPSMSGKKDALLGEGA